MSAITGTSSTRTPRSRVLLPLQRTSWLGLLLVLGCQSQAIEAARAPASGRVPAVHHAPDPGPLARHLARAKDVDKPLVVELSTAWCGPCRFFEKRVLTSPEVKAELEKVVFVRYDAEDGNGLDVAARYDVIGYPHFLSLDERGEVLAQTEGLLGLGTDWFLEFLKRAERSQDLSAR